MDKDDAVGTLNDLIETCNDGEKGFRTAAGHASSPEIKRVLEQHAQECMSGARELQTCVVQLGGKPEEGGTAAGAAHRGWTAMKGTLTGYSDAAILEECERGEDVAVSRYRKALEVDGLPPDVKAIVERQYQGVRRNHDEVRRLRDQARAAG